MKPNPELPPSGCIGASSHFAALAYRTHTFAFGAANPLSFALITTSDLRRTVFEPGCTVML